jgi:hypothetical protein
MVDPTPEINWVAFSAGKPEPQGRRSFLAIHKSNRYESDVRQVWYEGDWLVRWDLIIPATHWAHVTVPEPIQYTNEQWHAFMSAPHRLDSDD